MASLSTIVPTAADLEIWIAFKKAFSLPDSLSEASSASYSDKLTDDECANASPRLDRTGAMARPSGQRKEVVSHEDMEPVDYRLLEGTYLSSLEFGLSQVPPGESIRYLLRPENQVDLELSKKDHGDDCQIGDEPTGGASAEAENKAPETAEIHLTGNDHADASDSTTIEGDFEGKQDAAQDRKSCDQDGNGAQPSQPLQNAKSESGQVVGREDSVDAAGNSAKLKAPGDVSSDAASIIDTETASDTDSDAASIIDAETPSVTDIDAASITNTTPDDSIVEETEVAQDGEENEHKANTAQIDLPLVVPINEKFEVRNASMGGSGAFARKDLKLHDVILMEKYILTGDGLTMHKQFAALDAIAQRVYLCLHPHWPRDEQPVEILTAICNTNSFSIPGSKAVFLVASRFNHKCHIKCNLTYSYDSESEMLVIYVAVDHISAGDELTISYGAYPRTLYEQYGFFCSCGGCDGYTQAKADAVSRRNWI
ncbi:hypothetical protein RB598_002726 [Gaeumannomyces tritici]